MYKGWKLQECLVFAGSSSDVAVWNQLHLITNVCSARLGFKDSTENPELMTHSCNWRQQWFVDWWVDKNITTHIFFFVQATNIKLPVLIHNEISHSFMH